MHQERFPQPKIWSEDFKPNSFNWSKFLSDDKEAQNALKKLLVSGVFILDTGASNSCIGFVYDSYFNLNNEESEVKAAGAGALNMETALAKNNLLVIGKWKLKKMDFIIMDLSHVNEALKEANEIPVHGIIGADFLKKTRAVIDYGKNCFYII